MGKVRKKIQHACFGVSTVVVLFIATFPVVYEAYAQQGACVLVDARCRDTGSGENIVFMPNLYYCPSTRTYFYLPDCNAGETTATCLPWNDDFTELPKGSGNPEIIGASCQVVEDPTSLSNINSNAGFPSGITCEESAFFGNFFDPECVGFDSTALPVGTIVGITLGVVAGFLLIGGIITIVYVRKRTKRKEQEKGERMAKVVVLDAPAPPPLYGNENEEDLGLHEFSDDDDDYVKQLKQQGTIPSHKSGRHLGAYARPDLSLYGQEAQDADEMELGVHEDLNEHLQLGEHRRFYGEGTQGSERTYGAPDANPYYGGGYGAAPAKRQSNKSGEDKFARAAIVERMESRHSKNSGSTLTVARGSGATAMSRKSTLEVLEDAPEEFDNPYTYSNNERSPSVRPYTPISSLGGSTANNKFASPLRDRPEPQLQDQPNYGGRDTSSGYGNGTSRRSKSNGYGESKSSGYGNGYSSRSNRQPKSNSPPNDQLTPSYGGYGNGQSGRRSNKQKETVYSSYGKGEETPPSMWKQKQRQSGQGAASPHTASKSDWRDRGGSTSNRAREQRYGYGEFH